MVLRDPRLRGRKWLRSGVIFFVSTHGSRISQIANFFAQRCTTLSILFFVAIASQLAHSVELSPYTNTEPFLPVANSSGTAHILDTQANRNEIGATDDEVIRHQAEVESQELSNREIEDPCIFDQQWTNIEKCDWAKRCSFDSSHIPYNEVCFCWLRSTSLSSFILIPWIILLFGMTSTVSDSFLTPPMVRLATLLNLSETMAGCTLLAAANSAADIMTGAMAAYGNPSQLGIFIGGIFGGTFLLNTLVGGAVLWYSTFPIVKLSKWAQIRNAGFLFLNFSALFGLSFLPVSAWWAPFLLICSFISYVGLVIHMDSIPSQEPFYNSTVSVVVTDGAENYKETSPLLPVPQSGVVYTEHDGREGSTVLGNSGYLSDTSNEVRTYSKNLTVSDADHRTSSLAFKTRAGRRLLSRIITEPSAEMEKHLDIMRCYPAESLASIVVEVDNEKSFGNQLSRSWSKVVAVLYWPMVTVWSFTVPTINDTVSSWRTSLFFLTIPTVIALNSWRTIQPITIAAIFSAGAGMSLAYSGYRYLRYKVLSTYVEPGIVRSESGLIWTCVASFMVRWTEALFWNSVITGEVVQCIATLGLIQGVSNEILGLTVVAWGNNATDLFANVAISKAGHAEMGLSGTFGASVMTISFGIPLVAGVHALCQLMDGRPLTLIPFKLEVATIVTGIALACVSILWLIHAAVRKFKVSRWSGLLLIFSFFVVNVIVVVCVRVWQPLHR